VNTTTLAVLTGLFVVAGRWATKKPMTIKIVVGVMVFAIMLSVVDQANTKFATTLGYLGLVAAALLPPDGINGQEKPAIVAIVQGLGWNSK